MKITLNIGFNNIEDDKKIIYDYIGTIASKSAVEKLITHFVTYNHEDWVFVNYKCAAFSGTITSL